MTRPRRIRLPSRRFSRRSRWIVVVVVLVALIIADRQGWLLVRTVDDLAAYHGMEADVAYVIDGDTIEIKLPDALNNTPTTRVRLWGIDCPETAKFGVVAQPWANEARDLARSLADKQRVVLWLEAQRPRGSFGRVLAHVELPDQSILNEALLEAGLAQAVDRWPHSRLMRYAQLERAAQREGTGMWSSK